MQDISSRGKTTTIAVIPTQIKMGEVVSNIKFFDLIQRIFNTVSVLFFDTNKYGIL